MVIVVLHSDTFYCYLYFHSAWWWLLFYIQTPTAICTSTKPDGDCCPTFRHLLLIFVLPLRLMVIVVLHEDPPPSPTFRHLLLLCVLPLSLMVIVVLQKDPPPSPTFRHLLRICVLSLSLMVIDVLQGDPPLSPTFRRLLLVCVLPLSLMVIVILHSDTFYCYLYFHSVWWWLLSYIQTPSTAVCTSTKPDGDCCSTFRHLLLPFVLPLSLMVIVILHSDTFYCYLYFH